MSRKIYFDYGSCWEDVTPNVLDSVRIIERKCSDDYHYAQNVCNISVIMGDGPEIPDGSDSYYFKDSWTDDDGWTLTLGESDLPTTRGGVHKRDFITISGTMDYVVKIKATSTGASQIVLVGEKADNTYQPRNRDLVRSAFGRPAGQQR